MSDSVETREVLIFLSEGAADLRVSRAVWKFAGERPAAFAVLAAFHACTAFGAEVENHMARWKSQLRGLIAILNLRGKTAEKLLEGFIQGEYEETRTEAGTKYSNAVLQLDEWLFGHGYQRSDDRRPIAWDIVE